MKNKSSYILILAAAAVIIVMYGFKLRDMGIGLDDAIKFIALLAGTVAVVGVIIFIFTRGIRKKFDDELKNGAENNDDQV